MKNLIYIVIIGIFTVSLAFSQDYAYSGADSSGLQKKERMRNTSDSTRMNRGNQDKFIDNDGDGINDVRCGRGMGLGKGLGKHNCEPGNCEHNKSGNGNQGQGNQGKGKGKK
jgi:hypothetical protein